MIYHPSIMIFVVLRGVSEGGEAPLQEFKKFFVLVVCVVLVVLNS